MRKSRHIVRTEHLDNETSTRLRSAAKRLGLTLRLRKARDGSSLIYLVKRNRDIETRVPLSRANVLAFKKACSFSLGSGTIQELINHDVTYDAT